MATLENSFPGKSCLLRAHHTFGRDSRRCDTVIEDPYVSRMHAHIRWSGGRWELHDHSSNGTLVSGTLVRDGERVVLRQGDLIHFSKASAAHWRVGELSDPADMLWPLCEPAKPILLDTVHLLPGDATPAVTVLRSADGDWLCDDTPAMRVLRDGDEIVSGHLAWRLVLAHGPRSTLAMREPSELSGQLQQIDFTVSRDEEHVRAVLHTRGGTVDLGERAHHYCIVTLARRRCADAQAGYDTASQGWVDLEALARMLGTDVSHVNVQIHRARAQVGALLSPGSAQLVERRRGGVRFGATGFRVFRGEALECQSAPAAPADCALYRPLPAVTLPSLHAG
ncbi:FHA domain-containing protein [Paraburkholderia sp. ZP32-5]|uniref:FHA domain-containing protein n=1 Tax=Paraburkholderia sp. ZP32-5 TaxID=2883245 RepID=UPI001F3E9459|nr:FHA domain-containing protein [Paraburkholderia sp. ZP32-5]